MPAPATPAIFNSARRETGESDEMLWHMPLSSCEFKAFLGLPFSTCRADGPDLHDQVSEALVPLPEWPA